MKKLIYSRDNILNRIMILENKFANLEGITPPHKLKCYYCDGTGKLKTMIGDLNNDELSKTCNACQGKGE